MPRLRSLSTTNRPVSSVLGLTFYTLCCLAASLSAQDIPPLPAEGAPPEPPAQRRNTPSGEILSQLNARIMTTEETPHFQRHVLPLLGRLGCNGRACHGSFQGQGGFRLSMFGYDFKMDHENLVTGDTPRVDLRAPPESMILNKPTSADEHEGGKRFEKGGWEQQVLLRWIQSGAPNVTAEDAKFVRLEVTPSEITFSKPKETVQLKVIAVWSDGTREDVTCLTRFRANNDAVADITPDGLVQAKGPGDSYIISFYDNGIASTEVILPVSDRVGDQYPTVPAPTEIDRLVLKKLSKLGVVPSELSSDAEFLRRVSLDVTGTLPSPAEITEFLADTSTGKRTRKIDELLERPAYDVWWTMKLCDLTGSNAGYLGGTEMAQPVAAQWRSWIERRVHDNVGYDKIVEGILLATSRRPGQTYEDFMAHLSTYTRRQEPADFTALDNPMPHFWFRSNMSQPKDKALVFGYTFLGVRLDCAQCHKHPYDQWSKKDFEQFTAFFSRIKTGVAPDGKEAHTQLQRKLGVPKKLDTAALRRQMYMRVAAEGMPIPWQEVYIAPPSKNPKALRPKLLGGKEVADQEGVDPRVALMNWLKEKDNRYFAQAFVNRVWANYFNVGIVSPPDDFNLANPPSNKALLEYLSREFVAHGYDIKWLHRTITGSRTYQLSWRPNETNRRDEHNFSHAIVRRLPAEVSIDAVTHATANTARQKTQATDITNRKIGQHPKSFQARSIDYSLLVFGKPLRTTTCDCERQSAPSLLQALYLRNDDETHALLQRKSGWIQEVSINLAQPISSIGTGDAPSAIPGQILKRLELEKQLAALEEQDPQRKQIQAKLNQVLGQLPGPRRTYTPPEITVELTASLIREAYLRSLCRPPSEKELASCQKFLASAENTAEGLRDVMWSLLNTQEFITNH